MAVIKKTLFAENLDRYQTFVTDTNPTSDYFKITELSDTFTGGKNAFLIQGSDYLVPDTLIKIEIKDSKGNIIYHEPGEGIVSSSVNGTEVVTEYYEGVSKVVAVHIYPDTSFGPATITILGELSTYNSNGLNSPIPLEWEGKYNVKWQKQINVNPSLANTTKIRFYRRPVATIVETLSPIYTIISGSKVESNIVSSFANITLSKLDTFAGDVKRIKVYRTSEGDISDYDMIQDILLESKELLTSYNLTGSVIGEAGLMTSEVLQKLWSYPTLTTQLTSSRIDNGVKLNGNGYFRYTSSLQLSANSVYEFGIDAFYSASTNSDMGIYVSGSNNGEVLVGTLNGITPTKNLKDTVLQFTLPLDEPTASLYLSQSQSEWHIGNLSLKLTQDTAFSPSEISFVTSMPTVVGNETYNFKFEFYDVNNNYVPVLVTESALFTGGNNNIGGTLIFISASASSSLAQLNAVSTSISGTATLYSSSANTTIVTLSGSVSGSITSLSGSVDTTIVTLSGSVSGSIVTLSGSVSGSITSLSGSVSGSITSLSSSVSGSITTLSSSVSASITSLSASVSQSVYQGLLTSFARVQNLADGNYSGSFIGDNVIYSPVLGGQLGYFSTLFKVGQSPNSIYLDARQTPRKIFIGGSAPGGGDTEMSGAYNNTNTSVYLDSTGKFSLKDRLHFDGNTLTVNGTINVTGGNAATQTFASTIGTNAVASGSASASAAQTAAINQAKADASASVNALANGNWVGGTGTFITANSISSPIIAGNGGYISTIFKVGNNGITLDGTNKKIYVGGNGTTGLYNNANTPFYFASGSTDIFSLGDKLRWDGTTLGITGEIVITAGATKDAITAASTAAGNASTAASNASTAASNAATAAANAQTTANSKLGAGEAAADVNSNTTSISGGKIRTGIIESTGYSYSSGDYSSAGTQINLDNGLIRSRNFVITSGGDAKFRGTVDATGGSFGGWSIIGNQLKSTSNAIILDGGSNSITMTVDGLTRFNLNTNSTLPEPNVVGGGTIQIEPATTSFQGAGSVQYNSNTFTAGASVVTNFELKFINNSYVAEYGGGGISSVNVTYRIRNTTLNTIVVSTLLTTAVAQGGDSSFTEGSQSGGAVYQSATFLSNSDNKLEATLIAGHGYRAEIVFEYNTPEEGTPEAYEASFFRAYWTSPLLIYVAVQVATVVINGGGFLSAVNSGKYLRMSNLTPDAVNIEGGITWDKVGGRPGYVARAWVVATWSQRTNSFSSATIRASQNVLAVGRNALGFHQISFIQALPKGDVSYTGNYDTLGAVFASGLRRFVGAGSASSEWQTDIACNPNFGGGSSVMVYTYDNDRNAFENVNLLNVVVFA
jgi:hypothetical protein